MFVIELDDLKRSNALHGYSAGDSQLRKVGALVRELIGDRHFAARLTGDRLGIALIGSPDHELADFERTLRRGFATIDVSTAIGVGRRHPDRGLDGAVDDAESQLDRGITAQPVVTTGDAHEAALGDLSFKFATGARRFDLGNYNFANASMVDVSLGQILNVGTQRIEAHVCTLSHALAQGFYDLGLPVAGGVPGPHLAGIITVGTMSTDHYGTSDERFNRLYKFLGENNVKLSIRRGMLRFSLHGYNNMADVERVLALSKKFLGNTATR